MSRLTTLCFSVSILSVRIRHWKIIQQIRGSKLYLNGWLLKWLVAHGTVAAHSDVEPGHTYGGESSNGRKLFLLLFPSIRSLYQKIQVFYFSKAWSAPVELKVVSGLWATFSSPVWEEGALNVLLCVCFSSSPQTFSVVYKHITYISLISNDAVLTGSTCAWEFILLLFYFNFILIVSHSIYITL